MRWQLLFYQELVGLTWWELPDLEEAWNEGYLSGPTTDAAAAPDARHVNGRWPVADLQSRCLSAGPYCSYKRGRERAGRRDGREKGGQRPTAG